MINLSGTCGNLRSWTIEGIVVSHGQLLKVVYAHFTMFPDWLWWCLFLWMQRFEILSSRVHHLAKDTSHEIKKWLNIIVNLSSHMHTHLRKLKKYRFQISARVPYKESLINVEYGYVYFCKNLVHLSCRKNLRIFLSHLFSINLIMFVFCLSSFRYFYTKQMSENNTLTEVMKINKMPSLYCS